MSFHLYPVTPTELIHEDYEVTVNGILAATDTARVSAVPFNRRWPGHQRSEDQTELVSFLSLETDEVLHFEIRPKKPFTNVVIRPITLGITPEVTADGRILFTLEKPAYFTVESYGRQNALHIFADPPYDSRPAEDAEDVLYFGPGEHDVGMIILESNQTLFLDEGAVVYACVRAFDAENIRITGRGILDNSRNKETLLFEANEENNTAAVNNALRLHTIETEYCTNVKIDGITIRDSLVYNIRPVACRGVDIRNVKIIGCWRYNSDGIDMHNCTDVTITDCFLRTFDDSICVKGFDCYYEGDVEKAVHEAMYRNGQCYDVFRNVQIKGCVIWNDWGKCLEIGAETRGEEICDVCFENCCIIHPTHAVLSCCNVDYADVHHITYQNITIEFDDVLPCPMIQTADSHVYPTTYDNVTPYCISSDVKYHEEYSAKGTRRGKNHHFSYRNIRLYGKHMPLFHFEGFDKDHLVSDVTISNFYINDSPLTADGYKLYTNKFTENIRIESAE